jgi:hypothetical protein
MFLITHNRINSVAERRGRVCSTRISCSGWTQALNHGLDTRYPVLGLSWLSSVHPRKSWNSISNSVKTVSFHIMSYSLFALIIFHSTL